MINELTNRFILCGYLRECHLEIFDTHAKAKMVVSVQNYSHTIYYFVSKKFNIKEYEKFCTIANVLKQSNISIILGGNIAQRQSDYSILFYASYCDISVNKKQQENIDIEVDGFIYQDYLINVFRDTPRGFKLNLNDKARSTDYIYKLKNANIPTLKIENKIIQKLYDWKFTFKKTNKTISHNDKESYIAEWNIIKEDYHA